jgi:hypothetical protein
MRWTCFALALAAASMAAAQEAPPSAEAPPPPPPAVIPEPPADAAPPPYSPDALPSFTAGFWLGPLVPLRQATSGVSFSRYAPVMFELGADLGWRPAPWLWTGITGSLASGCETVILCDDTDAESQTLSRLGLAATVRLFGGDTELWVGGGLNGAWFTAGPWHLGGFELTVPRLELAWPFPGGRASLMLQANLGRFTQERTLGDVLPAWGQTLHATVLLAGRLAFEPRVDEGTTLEGAALEARRGFLLSGRLGGALPLVQPGNVAEAYLPFQLDVGYRFDPHVWASAFLELASGMASRCAPATGCDPFRGTLGLQVEFHPSPGSWRDPWIGVGGGWVELLVDRGEDGVSVTESWDGWLVRLEGGVQLMRWTYVTLGSFVSIDGGRWLDREVDVGGAILSLPLADPTHVTAQAGLRVAWLP